MSLGPRPRPAPGIRPFYLYRIEDASGVSGTGIVAVGVVLPSGKAVMEWRSRWKTLTVFESVEQVVLIHGHGGRTLFCWGLPEAPEALPFWRSLWRRLRRVPPPPDRPMLWALPAPPPRADASDPPAGLRRERLTQGWRALGRTVAQLRTPRSRQP